MFQDKSVTYEYLTVSKNTASSGSSSVEYGEENLPIPTFGEEQQHPPTPRPTHRPHHKLPGLNKKTGLFVAPMAGTYRVSFQVFLFSLTFELDMNFDNLGRPP